MNVLSKELLNSFIKDLREAVIYCSERPGAKHFRLEPDKSGLVLTAVWDRWDEFSESVAERIGKRFLDLWGIAWGSLSSKYSEIFVQTNT